MICKKRDVLALLSDRRKKLTLTHFKFRDTQYTLKTKFNRLFKNLVQKTYTDTYTWQGACDRRLDTTAHVANPSFGTLWYSVHTQHFSSRSASRGDLPELHLATHLAQSTPPHGKLLGSTKRCLQNGQLRMLLI